MGASTEYPSLKSLNDFLVSRARAQERVEQASKPPRSSGKPASYSAAAVSNSHSSDTKSPATNSSAALKKPPKKVFPPAQYPYDLCKGDHFIVRCTQFLGLTNAQRTQVVVDKRLCENCLGHHLPDACNSPFLCKISRRCLDRFWSTNVINHFNKYSGSTNKAKSLHINSPRSPTGPAPYLAVRALLQLVEDEGHRFSLAIVSLTHGRYVDDIFGGADDLNSLQQVADKLEALCKAGGFPLAKWASNHPKLQQLYHVEAIKNHKFEDSDSSTKILGMYWSSHSNQFYFTYSPPFSTQKFTKRIILSEIAQIFDPLGFLAPLIIRAKIFMQELWLKKLSWDTPLAANHQYKWRNFKNELKLISEIQIPRWIHSSTCSTTEIHGFSDASQLAMAAAVFIKVHTPAHGVRVTLLCSKTKAAPLKRLTIPRLELTAAHMLAKLIKHCQSTLNLTQSPTYLWTDSTITLTWIKSHPARWKEFVRNRVSHIQDLLPDGHWNFIPGTQNPADCATRGLTPTQLRDHQLWWTGPPWLLKSSSSWPKCPSIDDTGAQAEERPGLVLFSSNSSLKSNWPIIERPIPLLRMSRATAICFRLRDMIKKSPNSSLKTPITSDEVISALNFCIKETQPIHFSNEINMHSKHAPWPNSHPFARLVAFIDTDGIIRVGGRLENYPNQDQSKHPAILPRNVALTKLIISDAHQRTMHGDTQLTLAFIRQKYWIIGGRQLVRSIILKCIKCARHRADRAQQLMGQLPVSRVTPSPAFTHTGVDYAGPITLKNWRHRGAKTYKGWICVFVCLSTSAVHLEVVSDYSSSGFIAALRRFISRRGICTALYSDCGTTFKGAETDLNRLFTQ
ncbi:uncharacterized protein LOC130677734 [Microplitis mediator]|uniref:uncharacterized protein LOC130677734 n=1 Tax=Microplitis mediator TaxID=375433 RepID=UPI002553FA74|nr:uncharacterized protein LOC130677734 [Microplitis mediator]